MSLLYSGPHRRPCSPSCKPWSVLHNSSYPKNRLQSLLSHLFVRVCSPTQCVRAPTPPQAVPSFRGPQRLAGIRFAHFGLWSVLSTSSSESTLQTTVCSPCSSRMLETLSDKGASRMKHIPFFLCGNRTASELQPLEQPTVPSSRIDVLPRRNAAYTNSPAAPDARYKPRVHIIRASSA